MKRTYKFKKATKTTIRMNNGYEGETIEAKVRRIVNNKEPITDGAPMIYTERKDGIQAAYDIRTDRWEIAVEAMDKVQKTVAAKREERMKLAEEAIDGMKKEGEAQPTQATKN